MGGLAVAARLATVGHDVVVCEQADRVGGKVGTVERDGFVFDTGPSLLTLPAVYRDLFVKTGRPIEDSLDLVEVDPAFRYRFPRSTGSATATPVWLDVPNASRARTVAAMDAALGAGAGEDWAAFLDRAHQVWQVTRGPFLESPLDGPRDLVRLARRTSDVRTVAPWSSLRALGRKHLHDPRLRMLLDRYATYTGSDPRRAPAALAVVPYVEQTFGAWHVAGGLGRLADAVHERALLRGVDVRTGTEVTGVVVEGGRAAGVELADGQRLAADVVVAERRRDPPLRRPGPAHGGGVGPPPAGPRDAVAVRLRAAARACAAGRPSWPTTPCCSRQDYDAEFDAVFGRDARPVEDPTLYVCSPDDPAMRPDGARGVVRAGQRAAARRTAPGASTGARRGSPSRTPTGCSTGWPTAGWTSATGCCGTRCARRPTSSRRPARPAAPSTAPRPTAPGPPSCGRPTGRRCRGCSWSAGRPTPAAGCRWSACRRRSSPT